MINKLKSFFGINFDSLPSDRIFSLHIYSEYCKKKKTFFCFFIFDPYGCSCSLNNRKRFDFVILRTLTYLYYNIQFRFDSPRVIK